MWFSIFIIFPLKCSFDNIPIKFFLEFMPLINIKVENSIMNFSGKLLLVICLTEPPTISSCFVMGLQGLKTNVLGTTTTVWLAELLCICSCYISSTEPASGLDGHIKMQECFTNHQVKEIDLLWYLFHHWTFVMWKIQISLFLNQFESGFVTED